MKLRWTSAAAEDLETIANYLFEKTPIRATSLLSGARNPLASRRTPRDVQASNDLSARIR
jgi:plasmid stabilization system protein ParE